MRNFFKGFLTLQEMKEKGNLKPIRVIKPTVFRNYGKP
jgi:hypothetical protein